MARLKLNKGFVLSELLIALIIIGILNGLVISKLNLNVLESKTNVNSVSSNLITTKLKIMRTLEASCADNSLIKATNEVCFNAKGNVNQAQTVSIVNSSQSITIHLGAGVHEIK